MPVAGYVYPNEAEIQWSILIVIYPFITGLVAGAFIVSSLYHVFGVKSLKPVARFSLVMALAFLMVAPLPLLGHLGRPERALEIFLTPNPRSAMAGFGYICMGYMTLLAAETWLAFRPDIVAYAHQTSGLKRLVYWALSLGVLEITEDARRADERLIKILAAIGIPAAAVLHGYVGFLFGAIKANPWWSTPLMPVIFLLSAIVSGIALLMLLYYATMKLQGRPVDYDCLRALSGWLMGFLLLDLTLEGLEILSLAYEAEESWEAVRQLLTQQINVSFFGIQLLMGALAPLALLVRAQGNGLGQASRTFMSLLAAALVLVGVFAMRWNVVIGGQMLSKSLYGFVSYVPTLGGREGLLAAVALLILPLEIFAAITYFLPPWQQPSETVEEYPTGLGVSPDGLSTQQAYSEGR